MGLCSECNKKIWPYAIVLLVASFAAFLTWLTLSASGAVEVTVRWFSFAAFVVVGGALLGYMLCCLRRHCRHDDHQTSA